MSLSKNFLIPVVLGLALFAICKNVESFRPHPVCGNTTITAQQLANTTALQIDTIKRIWTATVSRDVSDRIKNYGNAILANIDRIDSPSVRELLVAQSALLLVFITNLDDSPGLCAYTRYLNATNEYIKTGKGCQEVASTLRDLSLITPSLCSMATVGSLCNKGCKNISNLPILDSKCPRRGRAYEIVPLLDTFGVNIPCWIRSAIIELHGSRELADNYVAITLAAFLPEDYIRAFNMLPYNNVFETLNILTETFSPHCCDIRRKRLDALCVQHNTSFVNAVQHIIDEMDHHDDDWED